MTAGVLTQDPNTWNVEKNAIYSEHENVRSKTLFQAAKQHLSNN